MSNSLLWVMVAAFIGAIACSVYLLRRAGRPNEISLARSPNYREVLSQPVLRMWEDRINKFDTRVGRHSAEIKDILNIEVNRATQTHIAKAEHKLRSVCQFRDKHRLLYEEEFENFGINPQMPEVSHSLTHHIRIYHRSLKQLDGCINKLDLYIKAYYMSKGVGK